MNNTHIHLILNHFPIIGTIIGTLFLLAGIWKKNRQLTGSALLTIAAMALIAIPVFLTGEPAEESVENIPGVMESAVEAHEESAELAFWIMEATGAMAIIGFLIMLIRTTVPNFLLFLVVFSGLVSFILMARTGLMGGKIRHMQEIEGISTVQNESTGNVEQEGDND